MAGPILEVKDLHKRFGGLHAVNGASFRVDPGSITGLIGPNGSGKTTTFNLITGQERPDRGQILYKGQPIHHLPVHAITNRGIARTFQLTRIFPELTVVENMLVAARSGGTADLERALGYLEFVGIQHLSNELAGRLSFGQRRLLEFVRLLMLDPELILLDEPFAGINPNVENRMVEHIRALQRQGKTFLIIDHEMKIIMDLCETVIVLDHGEVIASGPPALVQANPEVLAAYFGR